jgi:hypothetical protein
VSDCDRYSEGESKSAEKGAPDFCDELIPLVLVDDIE